MTKELSDLVNRYKKSDLTQKSFCKNEKIPIWRLRYGLYSKKRNASKTTKELNDSPFVPIQLSGEKEGLGKISRVIILEGSLSVKDLSALFTS